MLLLPLTACLVQGKALITRFSESDGLPQSMVTCVIQDTKGYIWISSWNGLSRYDGYRFNHYKARQGDNCPLSTNRILKIRELPGGNILCKCVEGYFLFDTKQKTFSASNDATPDTIQRYLPSPQVKALFDAIPEYAGIEKRILCYDRQGGYWVFTHRGLDRVLFAKEKLRPMKFGTEGEEFVRAAYRDRNGRVITADKSGFVRITSADGKSTAYLAPDGSLSSVRRPFGANVYSILQDSKGTLWLGAKKPGGLFRLTPRQGGGYTVRAFRKGSGVGQTLNNDFVYALSETPDGRILAGTYGGGLNIISSPHSENPQFLNNENLLKDYPREALFIHDMLLLKGGTLLIGTNDGLYSCSLKGAPQDMIYHANRRVPADAHSLSNNQVMGILQGRGGKVYVATYGGGLNIIESGNLLSGEMRFKALTTDNGMASDVVLNLCEDRRGHLWMVSEHSLMEYSPQTNTFTNYSESQFAGDFSFSEMRPIVGSGGKNLLIGTTQGFLDLPLGSIGKSRFVPRIVFDAPTEISLSPEERSLSITFAALDYNKNEPIRYAYRLEGVDNDWLYTTESRINLSNIPAGSHRLLIRSTNGDGVWVANEASVTISRTPYFNERPVAWMLYGALLIAILFIIYKVSRYIRRLEGEIKTLRLTSAERMEYIRVRLGDMMDSSVPQDFPQHLADGQAPGSAPEPAEGETADHGSAFRREVDECLMENLSDPDLSVVSFARKLNMSRSAFYVSVKNTFGCTPNVYILNFRINHAMRLLQQADDLNISQVAYSCGFSDPKYFSRCFKKLTGRTPTEVREESK